MADDADLVAALLGPDPTIDIPGLSEAVALSPARVRAALTLLGTAGQVGYDVAEASYFRRVLPYTAAAADEHNPRLVGARLLAGSGMVTPDPDGGAATVRGGAQTYRVRRSPHGYTCTCAWWAKHHGSRGPCRHALAADIMLVARSRSTIEVAR